MILHSHKTGDKVRVEINGIYVEGVVTEIEHHTGYRRTYKYQVLYVKVDDTDPKPFCAWNVLTIDTKKDK